MKILVPDEEFPYPPDTGKRIRSFSLIKRAAQANEIHYLAYGTEDSDSYRAMVENGLNPIAVPPQVPRKSGPMFYLRLLGNLLSKYPYVVSSHYSSVLAEALERVLNEKKPDLICCEWSPYAIFIRDVTGPKKMIVAHNIEGHIWQRYWENEKQPFKKWYIRNQWKKMESFERAAFGWADGATAVSDIEAREIQQLNQNIQVEVVDNGVDLEYFSPQENNFQSKQLVFVGSMNWRPNQDCVQHLVRDILPIVKKTEPDVSAVIVGQKPPREILELNNPPGVKITGRVDDVRPFIENGTVYTVPLRIGGGTRLKILEAMAMKKAVVSTTIGAEGLDIIDGENILLADSAEEFAEKTLLLLRDEEMCRRLGDAGRKLVENKYGWDSLASKLGSFVSRLVNES